MGKKVRMLLRVSSNQQLDADGDLNIQRQIVKDYIAKNPDWVLDKKEYFEGGVSGYKNAVSDRDTLQAALQDAQKHEYDILVVYKDDRIGRRMWEIGAYVMQLKSYGVDIYTVKDGCISPDSSDIMGQMMLALRYGNAQKSSADTGQRVKDTAQKLVKQGKFIGGKAPYGYELVLSGEISKHGRALHKLKIVQEQAEVVKHIFLVSYQKEYGYMMIAKTLNLDERYKSTAPRESWKAGTIKSILTNPIYCGLIAYKRREKSADGKHHRLDRQDWIYADDVNPEIAIIEQDLFFKVQDKLRKRSIEYRRLLDKGEYSKIIRRNDGKLPLVDVAYCGYCGRKLTANHSYSSWTIKGTGEKKVSAIPIYRCQNAQQGVIHDKTQQFKAHKYEKIVFDCINRYIEKLQDDVILYQQIADSQKKERIAILAKVKKAEAELKKIESDIITLQSKIPDVMAGAHVLRLDMLADTIKLFEDKKVAKVDEIKELQRQYDEMQVESTDVDEIYRLIPAWREVFESADAATKRVLVNKIIDRVDLKRDEVIIKFAINLDNFFETKRHEFYESHETIQYKHDSV